MPTEIIMCEGEPAELDPTHHYQTGHGTVYTVQVGGSVPGSIKFGSLEHIEAFHKAVESVLKQARRDRAKEYAYHRAYLAEMEVKKP